MSPVSISAFHVLAKGFGAQRLVGGQQPAPVGPGRVDLAAAPAVGFADDSLADLGEHVVAPRLGLGAPSIPSSNSSWNRASKSSRVANAGGGGSSTYTAAVFQNAASSRGFAQSKVRSTRVIICRT